MKRKICGFILLVALLSSCKKKTGDAGTTPPPPPPPVVETVPLKSVATFPIAAAASNGSFMTNTLSSGILKRDFNGITFENEMKNKFNKIESEILLNLIKSNITFLESQEVLTKDTSSILNTLLKFNNKNTIK